MNLIKRSSAERSLGRLRSEIDDLFERFFGDWPFGELWSAQTGIFPPIDVADQEDRVVVKAELPGVSADDIDLSVLDNTLTISGEKKQEKEEKHDGYYHAERRYGAFHRTVQLPASVDAEKVEAKFRDGVLTVTLPKDERARPKKIELKK